MKNIAILVDLELTTYAGGHVKFWERASYSIKNSYKKFHFSVFFLGNSFKKKKIGKNVTFYTLKPIISSKILKPLGVDADATDLFPINPKLFMILKNFDLIHSTDQLFTMAKTGLYASRFWKIPLTTSLHTDAPSYSGYYIKKIFKNFPEFVYSLFIDKIKLHHRIPEKQKLRMNNYLLHCEKGMVDDNIPFKKYKFESDVLDKITKLSRGVDKNIFKRKKIDKTSLFKKYEISKGDKVILFCGRIHELKGVFLLSKVHKILKNKIKLVSIFAGQNIHGDKCLEIGGNKIKLIGYVDENEIASLYNLCDLFVFPSKYEIGPQVVLEAKSCGAIPVVYPTGGGLRISKSGEDGIIIPKYDSAVWASEIKKLLNNKKKINYMRNKILNEFKPMSWNKIFQKFFIDEWNLILK